eukprot:4448323-Pleurochrysis_carterae.AAC.1
MPAEINWAMNLGACCWTQPEVVQHTPGSQVTLFTPNSTAVPMCSIMKRALLSPAAIAFCSQVRLFSGGLWQAERRRLPVRMPLPSHSDSMPRMKCFRSSLYSSIGSCLLGVLSVGFARALLVITCAFVSSTFL